MSIRYLIHAENCPKVSSVCRGKLPSGRLQKDILEPRSPLFMITPIQSRGKSQRVKAASLWRYMLSFSLWAKCLKVFSGSKVQKPSISTYTSLPIAEVFTALRELPAATFNYSTTPHHQQPQSRENFIVEGCWCGYCKVLAILTKRLPEQLILGKQIQIGMVHCIGSFS